MPDGMLAETPDPRSVVQRGMALLWRSVRTHPRPFTVAVLGATVFAAMTVGSTIVLGRVTDEVIVPGLAEERAGGTFGPVDGGTVLLVTLAVVIVALARAGG